MLENLRAEKKILGLALGVFLVLYLIAYGYAMTHVEPTEIGSVYNDEPRAFADNRTFKVGEEEAMKSFLQSAGYLKMYLSKEKISYFPIYKKTLVIDSALVVEIDNGEALVWNVPKIESQAVGYLGVTMNGDAEAEIKYLDNNNKIQKIIGVKK